jgi:hypothetical protein
MGTSTPSSGPGPGVPFDPPWLDEIPNDENQDSPPREPSDDEVPPQENLPQDQIAPPARFGGARIALGSFYRNGGGKGRYRNAVGRYSRTGMGGSSKVANRMRYSTRTASKLATFLSSVSAGGDTDTDQWVEDISSQNLSSDEIIDEIIRHVSPSGGSRDEESCKDSMALAMSDFHIRHEGVDLLHLDSEHIQAITELFIVNEAYNRLMNDIGQVSEKGNITPIEVVMRGNEMFEYLKIDISVEIENLWNENPNPTQTQLENLLRTAIKNTFEIYEEGI